MGISLFYRRDNQGSEKLSHFPKVTQLTHQWHSQDLNPALNALGSAFWY